MTTERRDLETMEWTELLALPHLTEAEQVVVRRRLEGEETRLDEALEAVERATVTVEAQKLACIQQHKKLTEFETLYKQRATNFAQLDRQKALYEQQARDYAVKQKACSQRQSALKGVERPMAPVERTKLLSIMHRQCDSVAHNVLDKEDDDDLFISVTTGEEGDSLALLLEQYLPRHLLL